MGILLKTERERERAGRKGEMHVSHAQLFKKGESDCMERRDGGRGRGGGLDCKIQSYGCQKW